MRNASRVLRSPTGRLRVGWRVALFLGLTAVVASGIGVRLPPGMVWNSLAILAGTLAAGWAVLRLDRRGLGAMGFYLAPSTPGEAVAGLGAGVGVALVVLALMAIVGAVSWRPEGGSLVSWLRGAIGTAGTLALPAAAEEALVRGYPLQALAEAWGSGRALLATSLVFGLAHLGNPGSTGLAVANIAVAGLFLGALYLRTGSLWLATGAHLGWNWALGYLADLPVSGLNVANAPLVRGAIHGPTWMGGGRFGPEGSVAATVVLLIAAALCWYGPWLGPSRAALAVRPLTPLAVNGEDVEDADETRVRG